MSEPKNIILLSDGTGNAANRVLKSNVWRIFESLDLRGEEQIAFYDDGVGTSSFKPLAILGGAFGWGLKRNVLDIYKFLCVNYKPQLPQAFAADLELRHGAMLSASIEMLCVDGDSVTVFPIPITGIPCASARRAPASLNQGGLGLAR